MAAGALAGWVTDRRGMLPVVAVGGLLGVAGLLLYATSESLPALLVAATLVGASVGSTELLLPLLIACLALPGEQAAATAGMNAIWGGRGLIVPAIAITPVVTGSIDVTGMLLICAAVTGFGVLLFLRMATYDPIVGPPEPAVAE
jgi:hypothetical protein